MGSVPLIVIGLALNTVISEIPERHDFSRQVRMVFIGTGVDVTDDNSFSSKFQLFPDLRSLDLGYAPDNISFTQNLRRTGRLVRQFERFIIVHNFDVIPLDHRFDNIPAGFEQNRIDGPQAFHPVDSSLGLRIDELKQLPL